MWQYCSSSNVLWRDSNDDLMLENMDKDDSHDESSECKESRKECKPRGSWHRGSNRCSFNSSSNVRHSERNANSDSDIMLESMDKNDSDDEMNDDTYKCK